MLSQDEQIALFVDAINQNALKMRREIEKDTKKLFSEQVQKLEQSAKAEMDRKLAYAENEIMTEINRKAAADKALYRRELCRRREELTNGVFEKARTILEDFSKSEAYPDFLIKSIEKIKTYLGDFVLFVKAGDTDKVKAAAEKAGVSCQIKEDTNIKVGGVRAESLSEGKIIDDTLDERLLEQREWFLSHTAGELNI